MLVASRSGKDTDKSKTGVVLGHAYTLIKVVTLHFNGQKHRLVQLRNPWGEGEFKGKWSDYDPTWAQVDPAEKKRIGFDSNKNDGIFFITY